MASKKVAKKAAKKELIVKGSGLDKFLKKFAHMAKRTKFVLIYNDTIRTNNSNRLCPIEFVAGTEYDTACKKIGKTVGLTGRDTTEVMRAADKDVESNWNPLTKREKEIRRRLLKAIEDNVTVK